MNNLINNYLITSDIEFDKTTLFKVKDEYLLLSNDEDSVIDLFALSEKIPYKNNSYEFALIYACLHAIISCGLGLNNVISPTCSNNPEWIVTERTDLLWEQFLLYLEKYKMVLTVDYISEWTLKAFETNAIKLALKYDLLDVSSTSNTINKDVCFYIEKPFLNFDFDFKELKKHSHSEGCIQNTNVSETLNQKLELILRITKQLYKAFGMPEIKSINKKNPGKDGFILNCSSSSFPIHKILECTVGVTENTVKNPDFLIDDVNYQVNSSRGPIHHLGDIATWILASMALEMDVVLGYECNSQFLYKISKKFVANIDIEPYTTSLEDNNYFYEQDSMIFVTKPSWCMIPKEGYKFILERSNLSENTVPHQVSEAAMSSTSNSTVHHYASNPVFQKYAKRNIDAITYSELEDKLLKFYYDIDNTPFFLKTVSGKFLIDIVGSDVKNSTYSVKEGNNGICDFKYTHHSIDLIKKEEWLQNAKNNENIRKVIFNTLLNKTSEGKYDDVKAYLNLLKNNPLPQWIISDIVDMNDEYRIFIVNHKVVVGSPCHRRSTPIDMYPIGRFHPGLSFSHRSKFIRINQKTRDRVAKYIKFARAFARDFKGYGQKHDDYHCAIHGNYILDVAWSPSKNEALAIEINEGNPKDPGHAGMYATNSIKLMASFMRKKYDSKQTERFISYLLTFGFFKIGKQKTIYIEHESSREGEYYKTKAIKDDYIEQKNLPPLLQKNIITGKKNSKYAYIKNPYFKNIPKRLTNRLPKSEIKVS